MMERTLEMIRGCVRLAWWDGSCIDLRLHRLTDLIDRLSAATEPTRPFPVGPLRRDPTR